MHTPQPNMTEIIAKLLSDQRVINAVAQALSEIMETHSHVDTVAETVDAPVIAQPETAPAKAKKVVDWKSKTKPQLYSAYNYRIKNNIPFEPEFEAALIKNMPGYDPEQKKFTGRGRGVRKSTETETVKSEIQPDVQPVVTSTKSAKKERIINWDEKTPDILKKAYDHRKKTGIDDDLNAALAKNFPDEYDPVARKFVKKAKTHSFATKGPNSSAPNQQQDRYSRKKTTSTKTSSKLSVTLKPVKTSLDATYYNVSVNGQVILKNHANTELKLFADGAILGVYGIVTDDYKLPQRPLWTLYKTDLTKYKWTGQGKFTKYGIYVRNIATTPTGLHISLSNGMLLLLENDIIKKRAGLARFEIER